MTKARWNKKEIIECSQELGEDDIVNKNFPARTPLLFARMFD